MYKFILLGIFVAFLQTQTKGASTRIVGGYISPLSYGRYQASLQGAIGNHVCGGAVISQQHIITVAHCVAKVLPEHIRMVLGTANLDVGGKQYGTNFIIIHPGFNDTTRSHDIAILKATQEFDLNIVQILDLYRYQLNEGESIILTGFGASNPRDESKRSLHMLSLNVFSQEVCRYAMRKSRAVTDSMFCTFNEIGQGTCYGDSGSALIKDNQLAGLVSWGIPCAVGFPDVHTRIFSYIAWIQEQINK